MLLDEPRYLLASARRPRLGEVWTVVLAAGASRRMGRSKALHPLGRFTFLSLILRLYQALRLPVCVVVRTGSASEEAVAMRAGSLVVRNPQPEQGPLSSLLLAMQRIGGVSGLIVHPVDHPLVGGNSIRRLMWAHHRHPGCILIPSHHRRKGHPVLFPARFLPDLKQAPLEAGARWVVRRHLSAVLWIPVEDEGILANLNTAGQLDYWSKRAIVG